MLTPALFLTMSLLGTPNAVAQAVVADLEQVPEVERATTRYLCYGVAEEFIAASYVLNAVSRGKIIVKPVHVRAKIVRLNLASYANLREENSVAELRNAWEWLVAEDPYFHLTTQVALADGKVKTVTVDGGWIDRATSEKMRVLSGSAGAVLRADFFVSRVSEAVDYYRFAGVPGKEADLFAKLGVKVEDLNALAADSAANLLISKVTDKPRRIKHLPGPLGGIWFTKDVEKVSPDRDPIRNPIDFEGPVGKQKFNFDATEVFAMKPNGFWLLALFNAKGELQNSVPDKIAKDTTSHSGVLQPLISCIRCHELHGGSAGLQPFSDDQYPLISGEAAILKSYVPDVAIRVAETYNPMRLTKEQSRDREDYEDAVVEATGVSTKAAAEALSKSYFWYVERPVTRKIAALECGLSEEQFVEKMAVSTDPVVLALRAGREVKRASFESSFQEIMLRRGP